VPVTRDNWRASLALGVHPEQQRFVADYAPIAALALAKAYVGAGEKSWRPFLIEAEGGFVGFVALAVPEGDQAPRQCWVFHFFIDSAQQGMGNGRAAVQALIGEVRQRYPECEAISLTVHPENTNARQLYETAGFTATGEEQDGEPVYALAVGELAGF
jgi:diamine N-acetyltransferase